MGGGQSRDLPGSVLARMSVVGAGVVWRGTTPPAACTRRPPAGRADATIGVMPPRALPSGLTARAAVRRAGGRPRSRRDPTLGRSRGRQSCPAPGSARSSTNAAILLCGLATGVLSARLLAPEGAGRWRPFCSGRT